MLLFRVSDYQGGAAIAPPEPDRGESVGQAGQYRQDQDPDDDVRNVPLAGQRQGGPHHPLGAEDDQRHCDDDQEDHLPHGLLGIRDRCDGAVARPRLRSARVEAPAPEQDRVGDRDQQEGGRGRRGRNQVEDQAPCDRRREQGDGALDRQRPPGQVDRAGQHRAGTDHRGEIEDIRAEDHAHAHPLLARRECDQGGGELRAIGGQCREQTDEWLGEPDPRPDVVEPVGEQRGRTEGDGDGERRTAALPGRG